MKATAITSALVFVAFVGCSKDPASKAADGGPNPRLDAALDQAPPRDVGSVDVGATDAGPLPLGPPSTVGARILPIVPIAVAAGPAGWVVLGPLAAGTTVAGESITGQFAAVGLDGDGAPTWGQGITARDRDDELNDVVVTDDGSTVVSMTSYSATLDFGDGITITGDPITRVGFAALFDSGGVTQWAQRFYTYSGVGNLLVATSGDDLTVGGTYAIWDPFEYQSTDGFVSTSEFQRSANRTSFALGLEPASGLAHWLTRWSAPSEGATTTALAKLADGGVVAAGTFEGGMMLDPDGNTFTTETEGGFVRVHEATGEHRWTTVLPGTQELRLATNRGRLIVAGSFATSLDIGLGEAEGPGLFVADVNPVTGVIESQMALQGQSTVVDITDTVAGLVVLADLLAGTSATVGDAHVPDGVSYLVGFGTDWSPRWLSIFAADALPSAIASDQSRVAVVGGFTGTYNFGGSPLTAVSASAGFLWMVEP